MSKWAFTLTKTEDGYFTMFFCGKIPLQIMKVILGFGVGGAVVELIKQHIK